MRIWHWALLIAFASSLALVALAYWLDRRDLELERREQLLDELWDEAVAALRARR